MIDVGMAAPRLERNEIDAALQVLESGALRQGKKAAQFEEKFAQYVGCKYAYTCSSGTAALHLAYLSLIEPGDEILVPTFTFFATASAVALAGGTPIFCDIDRETFLLDLEDAEKRLTPKTKAICVVHLFGQPFPKEPLQSFAERHGLKTIGDAAQALGSKLGDESVDYYADATTHSFYPTKNLFVGEGGMVTTNDEKLNDRGRLLRAHGQHKKYRHSILGMNYRMTDVEAAIGLTQMGRLDQQNERRRQVARAYDEAFANHDSIVVPKVCPGAYHTYHQYTLTFKGAAKDKRDEIQKRLGELGVGSQINYPVPLHKQEVFSELFASDKEQLPVADELCDTVLSIPVHHHLTDEQVQKAIAAVAQAVDGK